uniref:AMP-dependent synthetase/ligase domain-containing protein n=1 Tax=Odontella aurita TaxID=265563 RepID=A0A7S4I4Q8_9STRA|mmetsp:Transcript_19926/g.57739  ORF Transcript_19926/g.57739 Transcript_19926/m.57739 type:complete len:381 (+) Transcript_19926:333-1475(+)
MPSSDEPPSSSDGSPSLLSCLSSNASSYPDKIALTFLTSGSDGGSITSQLTYSALERRTSNLARSLLSKHSLAKGERAVLVYPPGLDFAMAFVACLKAGIVAVPVFPPHPARGDTIRGFAGIVEGCGARFALTCGEYRGAKKLGEMKDKLSRFKKGTTSPWPENLEWITTDGDISKKGGEDDPPLPHPSPSDTAFLQYTSGSTSAPKGVMITHGNLAHNLHIITSELEAADDTVVVSWLPQYHDMGLIGSYLGILHCGGSGYYMSPLTFLQRPMMWIEAVSKYGGTHLQAPNFAFKLTARKFDPKSYPPGWLKLNSVRHIINGAEPCTSSSMDAFQDAFGVYGLRGEVMFPTYGLAEHTVFVCSGGTQRLRVRKRELEVQ